MPAQDFTLKDQQAEVDLTVSGKKSMNVNNPSQRQQEDINGIRLSAPSLLSNASDASTDSLLTSTGRDLPKSYQREFDEGLPGRRSSTSSRKYRDTTSSIVSDTESKTHLLSESDDDKSHYAYGREDFNLSQIFFEEVKHTFDNLRAAGKRLFTFSQLPEYLRDNEDIWTGYRVHYTFKECLKSVVEIHNETGNIWTHLLGAAFFLILIPLCWFGAANLVPEEAHFADHLMLTIFLLSAVKCLLCSTVFHTFSAHTHAKIYDTVAILDYSGISVLIFGSFMIMLNYGLYCYTTLRWIYIGITGTFCATGIVLPWFSFFRQSSFRGFRTMFFVTMGLASGGIALHTVYLNGWHLMNLIVPMEIYALEVFCYLFGAFIYAKRIPEVWFPGKLDHLFHSHQWWHLFVFLGAYFHYQATSILMHSRLTMDTCASAFTGKSLSRLF